jgi:hypothetical protein
MTMQELGDPPPDARILERPLRALPEPVHGFAGLALCGWDLVPLQDRDFVKVGGKGSSREQAGEAPPDDGSSGGGVG